MKAIQMFLSNAIQTGVHQVTRSFQAINQKPCVKCKQSCNEIEYTGRNIKDHQTIECNMPQKSFTSQFKLTSANGPIVQNLWISCTDPTINVVHVKLLGHTSTMCKVNDENVVHCTNNERKTMKFYKTNKFHNKYALSQSLEFAIEFDQPINSYEVSINYL